MIDSDAAIDSVFNDVVKFLQRQMNMSGTADMCQKIAANIARVRFIANNHRLYKSYMDMVKYGDGVDRAGFVQPGSQNTSKYDAFDFFLMELFKWDAKNKWGIPTCEDSYNLYYAIKKLKVAMSPLPKKIVFKLTPVELLLQMRQHDKQK